jgi:hypothetical protein
MTISDPVLLQFDQRIDRIQHSRLEGVKLTKSDPKHLLDSLIIARRDRRRLGVHGSGLRCEPGLELGCSLSMSAITLSQLSG